MIETDSEYFNQDESDLDDGEIEGEFDHGETRFDIEFFEEGQYRITSEDGNVSDSMIITIDDETSEISYSSELVSAYEYAYENDMTSATSIDDANMYGELTRIVLAEMISNFSINVLGNTPDNNTGCYYNDISSFDENIQLAAIEACQLGLMGVGIDNFNPYGIVTRAEFGTVLSRTLWGDVYNGGSPYYANHLAALQAAGIMNNISPNLVELV
jgi:hypothetical protein